MAWAQTIFLVCGCVPDISALIDIAILFAIKLKDHALGFVKLDKPRLTLISGLVTKNINNFCLNSYIS